MPNWRRRISQRSSSCSSSSSASSASTSIGASTGSAASSAALGRLETGELLDVLGGCSFVLGVRSLVFDELVGRDELDVSVLHSITSSLKPAKPRPHHLGNVP
jgi:hypothetical protein